MGGAREENRQNRKRKKIAFSLWFGFCESYGCCYLSGGIYFRYVGTLGLTNSRVFGSGGSWRRGANGAIAAAIRQVGGIRGVAHGLVAAVTVPGFVVEALAIAGQALGVGARCGKEAATAFGFLGIAGKGVPMAGICLIVAVCTVRGVQYEGREEAQCEEQSATAGHCWHLLAARRLDLFFLAVRHEAKTLKWPNLGQRQSVASS